jgi:Zn-dependent protease with chaperone function
MSQRIRAQITSIPALALYAATLVAEVPVILTRMLVFLLAVVLFKLLKDGSASGAEGLIDLALIPTAWSILALITPFGGGWWWRQKMGGREPSERERLAYQDALELLRQHTNEPLHLPGSWFVIDSVQPDAAVCGNTLMLSRGLLEGEHVAAVLAHELGHLATSDGKLTAALNRLVIHPPPITQAEPSQPRGAAVVVTGDRAMLTVTFLGGVLWLARKTVAFAKGGFALKVLAPAWGSYWREREYLADLYAAQLGQADELADFLEIHALIHDHPVPFIWLSEHSHPPSELRIDRLRKAALDLPALVAPGSEPVKAAPAGPPAAGPDGPTLTEPDPSAGESLRSAGMALPTFSHRESGGFDA